MQARAPTSYVRLLCPPGNSSSAQVQNSALYLNNATTNKWAWYPSACTTAYRYICEVPKSVYACPPAPPPMPPPSPDADLCKGCGINCLQAAPNGV